jgi:hypothetical protein
MPDYSDQIKTKLTALAALSPAERRPSEVLALYFGSPDLTKVYAVAPYDAWPGFENLSAALTAQLGFNASLIVSLIPTKNTPFSEQPRSASIADDAVDFTFSDIDGEISRLVATYGEGVRAEVFGYWPKVDLLLSLWRGLTKAPKEMSQATLKLSCSTGFRSPNLSLPRRPHATSCVFIFGALLSSQAQIDYFRGCPYNAHLGGSTGVPGFTSCPRSKVSDCSARLVTKNYWPGFDVRPDPIQNNQTRGPNLLATAQGNASNLADPVRVVIGTRYVKSLALLAYRNETNTNHPDKGFGAGVFEVCEGPVVALWNFYMNGVYVTSDHSNYRLGDLGQSPTFFSPNINSFSGTAHVFGRIQGSFNDNQAASLTGQIQCQGLKNIRTYSSPTAYVKQYSTNRMDAILECCTNPRWGLGNDYSRYDLQSVVDTRVWCDQTVAMHDPAGNLLTGTRSTCNVELTGRAAQQQIGDLCTAGRIGVPFEFQGKDVFVPIKKEDITDPLIPVFTDEGTDRNITRDKNLSTLTWSQTADADLPNQWTLNFDDAANGGTETQLIFGDQAQQLRAGRAYGDLSIRVVNKSQPAFGITNFSEAARLGNLLLYLGPNDAGGIKNNLEIKFTAWYASALFVRMYSLIKVTNAKMQRFALLNLGTAYQYFRVKKIVRKGDLKVEITAQVYPQDFYNTMEDITVPPPLFVPGGNPNPGGRPGDIPEPILPVSFAHTGDRIEGQFAVSAY